MTMRIKITNEDQSRSLRVTALDHKMGDLGERAKGEEPRIEVLGRLEPSETKEFWQHSMRDLLLEEI